MWKTIKALLATRKLLREQAKSEEFENYTLKEWREHVEATFDGIK